MDNKRDGKIVTLKDLWDILIHRFWIIMLVSVLCTVGVFAVIKTTYVPQYSCTATLYILKQNEEASSNEAATDFSLALKVINDCTYLLKSHTVLNEVKETLALNAGYAELYNSISTSNPEDTRVLEVTVVADSPEEAKNIVDSVCTIGTEKINDAMGYEQVNFYEYGTFNSQPCNKTGMTAYFMVAVVAALLTYSAFLIGFLLDDSLQTEDDIKRYLGLSILGDIPDASGNHRRKYGYYGGYGYGNKKSEKKKGRD